MIGRTLAHYEISELLGKGGMGEVYRARDTRLEREVAVKVLPSEFARDEERLERLRREAKAVAALNHPHIVTLFSVEEDDGTHFLTMELVEGSSLERILSPSGLPVSKLREIGIAVADALAAAHDQGVVHRDLKPANVVLGRDGRVKVLDFGIAKMGSTQSLREGATEPVALTREGDTLGTLPYMSPEQITGDEVDARSDVFALGVLLYEMSTGRRPFGGRSPAETASSILRDDPPTPDSLRGGLPADLVRIVRRCLAKSADRRIQTARDVRNELEEIVDEYPEQGPPGPGSSAHRREVTEGRWTITTEHVRQLEERVPAMMGDSISYLDNQRESNVLVLCVHGLGADQTDYDDVLRHTPYRAIAPSMYGFGPTARHRPALPMADHERLILLMFEELIDRLTPETLILVGHSSGADQLLRILAGEESRSIRPDALVALGPATRPSPMAISTRYLELTGEPQNTLRVIQAISSGAEDLDQWLADHEYLARAFRKFRYDVGPLRRFASDLVASRPPGAFFEYFRAVSARVPQIRCVFAIEEADDRDHALRRHLEEDALGENFSEEMFVDARAHHIDMRNASVLAPLLEELVKAIESGAD